MNRCQFGFHKWKTVSHRTVFHDGLDREIRTVHECAACKRIKTHPRRSGVNTDYVITHTVLGFKFRRHVSMVAFMAYVLRNQDRAILSDGRPDTNEVTCILKDTP